jgi:iron complex outermembrane receptor protein
MNRSRYLLGVSLSALVYGAVGSEPAIAQEANQPATDATAPHAKKKKSDADKDAATIIITGRRKSLADAIAIKKQSDTIVDSFVSDEADKLPDSSITEILQRVSGVTLSRFTASNGGTPSFQIEGTGVSVRGLPYNSSTLNGRQVFSANGASAISWGEVTPELMAGVDVYKASRADLIEGGASLVDLRTHLPFDFNKAIFDVSVGASYGDQVRKTSPNISALYSKRFETGIGEIGVLWDFAWNRYYSQSSDLQLSPFVAEYAPGAPNQLGLVPSGYSWNQSKFKRDRYGAYQALQWKPSSSLTFTNTVFYSQYVTDSLGTGAGFGNSPSAAATYIPENATFDSNGAMTSGSLRYGATGQVVFGPGGNTWLQQYAPASWGGWSPAPTTDCGGGAGYGGPVAQATADWANGVFSCTQPLSNLQGFSGSSSAGHSKNSTLDVSQSVVWTPTDHIRVRGAGQFVLSKANGKNMYAGITQTDPNLSSASFDVTGSVPVLGGFDADALKNTSTAYWNSMSYNGSDNKGKMFAGNIDADYSFGEDSVLRAISVGARASKRTENDNFIGTYWAPLAETWAGIQYFLNDTQNPANSSPPSDYMVATFPHFFGGKTPIPGNVLVPSTNLMKTYDWCYLQQHYNGAIPNGTCDQYWVQNFDQGRGITDSKIVNVAGYVEARFGHDRIGIIPKFSGNIGVRVFRDNLTSHGNFAQGAAGQQGFFLNAVDAAAGAAAQMANAQPDPSTVWFTITSNTPRTLKYSYTRVLPSTNIRFDFSPKFITRLAASESASPPNLGDVRAGGFVNPNTKSLSFPNPGGTPPTVSVDLLNNMINQSAGAKLKPVRIRNEDISFEYYPTSQTFFYLDLFAKQVRDQDIFRAFVQVQPTPLVNGLGETQTFDLPWTYLQNETSDKPAYIKGFEVGGRRFFDKLPGLFKGIGVSGSLTYVDSKNPAPQAQDVLNPNAPSATNPSRDYGTLPYYGLSKISYNIELLYNHGPINIRLAYNWHSKQLLSTNANPYAFSATGGNPYQVNLSPTDFSPQSSFPAYMMIPLYSAAAGYVDFGIEYKLNSRMSLSLQANNITNTLSKTYQEPMPGVFLPAHTYTSDRRVSMSARMRF